jgi:hypothetical protein
VNTSFRFDMMPWKLVFCDLGATACRGRGELIYIDELPDAPEPGRIPKGADHVHIVAKYSGERDAREEEKWRALLKSAARCEHGRMMGERCNSCPGHVSSDKVGYVVGTTQDGRTVVVPEHELLNDIKAWISD